MACRLLWPKLVQRAINSLMVLGAVLLAACSTNPQPFPLPLAPDPKAIFVSNPNYGTAPAVTTGLPAAVTAPLSGDEVAVSVSPHPQQQRGPVFPDGSFSLKLGTLVQGDSLEAWVERDGEQSAHVVVSWRGDSANFGALTVDSVSPVSAGLSTVSGHFDSGWQVVIGNARDGAAALATVGGGTFSTSIAAAAGDTLALFGRDPSTSITTVSQEVTVPGP